MQKKYWKPLIIATVLTSAIAIATTAVIVVNQRPNPILPIYDYYFNQPVLKQLNDHQYQLKISGKNLNQFVDKKIDQITLIDFNKQTMINDQVASWTNFSLDEQNLVTIITLKQPIAADLYLAIDFRVAPSNAFAFNENQIPYQQVTLGTWYFYQNPDLIKVVTIEAPTTNDYQTFHFAIQGQNLDQLVDQIDNLVEIKLLVGNEVDHQGFHVKLTPVLKNLQTTYQLELQLDHPIKTQLQAQLNWFQFQTLTIKPTTNFNGFQTGFERQPILIAQSALVNIDFKQSNIKQISDQIEVGQINNYYFYQVDLVATNLDLIKEQIAQGNINVFPIVNFQNQTFIIAYQSSQIENNHWKFQIKTTKLIDQSGQFDFHFDPDQNVIANNSLQWQLPFTYDQPIVEQVQLINDPSDPNRFYFKFNGKNLRNWLWSQWEQLTTPIVSLSWNDFTIISPAGKILHPFRENLTQNGIRFSIKDPHDYQNPNDQNWDQPIIYSIDSIPIDPAIQVAPGSNWQINFPKVANQIVHFPVSATNIDQSLDPTYQPINKFAIKSRAKFSDHIANATQLGDQDLNQNWIVTNLITNLDQYLYVEGNLDPTWDWKQHLQISNRIFDANNGILSFNLTITNAFDGQNDLVFDQPIVWSGFKTTPTTNYDYQFSLVANPITLQLNQNEQDWSAITTYQQWPAALKQLIYRKWDQIFKFSGNLDPLWKVEKNLHIDHLQFQIVDQSRQLYQIQFRLGLNFPQANQNQPLSTTITLNNIYLMQPQLKWKINNFQFQVDPNVKIDPNWLITNFYQQWFEIDQVVNYEQLMQMLKINLNNQQATISSTGINPITNLKLQNPVEQIISWTYYDLIADIGLGDQHLLTTTDVIETSQLWKQNFDPSLLFYEKWSGDFPQLNSFNFQSFNLNQFKYLINSQIDLLFKESYGSTPSTDYSGIWYYFGKQIGSKATNKDLLLINDLKYDPQSQKFTLKFKTTQQPLPNLNNSPNDEYRWIFRWDEFNHFIKKWWKPININDAFKQDEIFIKNIKWPPTKDHETGLALYLRAQIVKEFELFLTRTYGNDHRLTSFELLKFDDQFVKFDQSNQQAIVKFQYQDINGWHDHQIIFKGFSPIINGFFPQHPPEWSPHNTIQGSWLGKNLWRFNQGWLEWLFPLFFQNYIDPNDGSYVPINQFELKFQIDLNASQNNLNGLTIKITSFDHQPNDQFMINPIKINTPNLFLPVVKQQYLSPIWNIQLTNARNPGFINDLNLIKGYWIKTMISDNQLNVNDFDDYWWLTKLDQQEINGQIKPVFSIASTYINGQPDWNQFQYQFDFALINKIALNGFQLNTQTIKIATGQFDPNQNFDRNWLKDFLWTNVTKLATTDLDSQATYQSWANWFATNVQNFSWIDVKTLKIILANQQAVHLNFDHPFSQQWQFQTNLNLSASMFINLNSNPTLDDVIKSNWHLFIKPSVANSALNLHDYNQILSASIIKNDLKTVQLQLILKNDQFAIDQGGWVGKKNLIQTFTITKPTQNLPTGYYQFIDHFPTTYQFESPQSITQFNNEQLIKSWLIANQKQWFVAIDQPDPINRHLKIDQLVINDQSVSFQINLFNDHLAVQQKTLTLSNLFANPYQFSFTNNSQLTIIQNNPNQDITLELLKSWIVTNRWKWLKLSQGKIPFQFDFWNQIVVNNYQKIADNNYTYQVAISLNDANAAHETIRTTLKLILVEN